MLIMDNIKPNVAMSIPEVNTWHLISILFKTFKNIDIEEYEKNKYYIRVSIEDEDIDYRITGTTLDETMCILLQQIWNKIPVETQKILLNIQGDINNNESNKDSKSTGKIHST